jgi:hypothetical protein
VWNHELDQKLKKSENPRFCGLNKLLSLHPTLKPLGTLSNVAAYRGFSKNRGKMSLQPILNKKLPWAHMELEFDVLGIAGKLVKHFVHLYQNIFLK